MSVTNVDLVTFENDSVVNQKSISLPIGKVSIRQTIILFVGILVTFLAFIISDNLIISGLIFAIFLGLGLIGTKVMSLDQMLKSHLILLIRKTSLDVKHGYMEKKSKGKLSTPSKSGEAGEDGNYSKPKTRLQELEEEQQKNNTGLVDKALSELQSIFGKKDGKTKKVNAPVTGNPINSLKNKKYLSNVKLSNQNILNVSLSKTKKHKNKVVSDDGNKDNQPINKMLHRLSKKKKGDSLSSDLANDGEKDEDTKLSKRVTISIDGDKLEESQYSINSDNEISVVLGKNKTLGTSASYEITAIADHNHDYDPINNL